MTIQSDFRVFHSRMCDRDFDYHIKGSNRARYLDGHSASRGRVSVQISEDLIREISNSILSPAIIGLEFFLEDNLKGYESRVEWTLNELIDKAKEMGANKEALIQEAIVEILSIEEEAERSW